MLGVVLSWVLMFASALPQQMLPPRDAIPPSGDATAAVRGRVIDRDSKEGLAGMQVVLHHIGGQSPHAGLTDEDGRFEFTRLAAGRYELLVSNQQNRAAYVSQPFVDRDANGQPRPFVLAHGEVRANVDVALVRALAIDGRIVDGQGEPVSDLRVSAHPLTSSGGWSSSFFPRTTDDRGVFRLFGLAPGRYRICAEPATSIGERLTDAFVRTCYPSAASDGEATPVRIQQGESPQVEIRMLTSRAFTLTGVVVDPAGGKLPPLNAMLNVMKDGGGSGQGIVVEPGGGFTVRGVTPGDYSLYVQSGKPFEAPRNDPQMLVGHLAFSVASDLDNLVVTLTKPVNVTGRIIFEDGPPPGRTPALKVRAMDGARVSRMSLPPEAASVREDLTFELEALQLSQVLQVEGLPRGWVVRSIRYRNEEIVGRPTEFKATSDPRDLEIVVTARGARVVARVVDDIGNPAKDGRVVMFPVDPREWLFSVHTIHRGIARDDGRSGLGPVRPGEYFITAVPVDDYTYLTHPSRLAALAKLAERITLVENGEQEIDVRVARER